MTFIVAIQLNDSIIVASDNKKVSQQKDGIIKFSPEKILKMHSWQNGIITGSGEYQVISRAVNLFKNLPTPSIENLPHCLVISRIIRESEIGNDLYQVENSKLLCSSYNDNGAQLYKIEKFSTQQDYFPIPLESNEIIIWLAHPNIDVIASNLQSLYVGLKDYSVFSSKTDWMNYYIKQLSPIFKIQSQIDPLMSQSFDIFLQSRSEFLLNHVPNT
ncbi:MULTISPECIES: hypothetical protein [Acinetobacter]|nr:MULTISPECIES: hypothetical protein [Acinetobacter]MEB3796793.1 hypothetical protein [Acinetobacter sp. IK24]MEB3815947.1 hypothetical protein [Acinetobacter sp. IK22]MEB3835229.1 hypothetical protein [Acinetobacter sp. IK23]MEB3838774.1 hypothetical protein [Acinetobacter sp. IK25]